MVAKIVHDRAGALNKRCTALGGAKNVSLFVVLFR